MRVLYPAFVASALAFALRSMSAQGSARTLTLVEPFGEAQLNYDNFEMHSPRGAPAERRALLTANLSGKGFEARSRTIRLGRQPIVLVRGWTREGTGLQQVSYLAFAPGGDSLRLLWSAVAEEISSPPRALQSERDKPYDLRGCLYVIRDSLLAYVSIGAPIGERALSEPVTRRSGLYAWSPATRDLRWMADAPEPAVTTCKRAPGAARTSR